MDQACAASEAIRGRRNAEDLNWRYRQDPIHDYAILTARRGEQLVAFVVYSSTGDDATVVDLFGREMFEAGVTLLEEVSERCCASGIQTLHASLSRGNPAAEIFVRAGFQMREIGTQVVAYAKSGGEIAPLLEGAARWSFSQSEILA